jgi:hypothetical protein
MCVHEKFHILPSYVRRWSLILAMTTSSVRFIFYYNIYINICPHVYVYVQEIEEYRICAYIYIYIYIYMALSSCNLLITVGQPASRPASCN